jgi:uncharacterized iron-regulated membrane protein
MIRKIFLNVHLVLGLLAAVVLIIVGLTGSILAFDGYYDRWLNPSLWRATPQAHRISEASLQSTVQRRYASVAIERIDMADSNSAHVFTLADGTRVFVDPYTGAVLGTRGDAEAGSFLKTVRKLHTRLGSGYMGRLVVDIATIQVVPLIATGLCLWWKKKRLTVACRQSFPRINWDLHNAVGAYASLFLLLLSVSGFFIAFEGALFWVTRSTPQPASRPVHSRRPFGAVTAGVPDITVDEALAAADRVFPELPTARIRLPGGPLSTYVIEKYTPQWIAGSARSAVFIDRYSGEVLRVDNARLDTFGYRAYRINLAIHTGEILGLPSRIVLAISSLLLPLLAITGILMWLKRRRLAARTPSGATRESVRLANVPSCESEFAAVAHQSGNQC